ncbi:MAG TPA: alkaline phosphatase family protein [Steroidobacteraceae bacterium]|nr:alkaline phosphatase family protein [Steroidobacteraceae bacterium]
MRRAVLLGVAALLPLGASAAGAAVPPIRHVFIVMLENQNAAVTFGERSPSPYLARTLPAQGALLTHYYGIGHSSLDNYIALVSGQAPNEQTQLDCPVFSDFRLQRADLDAHGQALGVGCVYPRMVRTLPDQLEAAGLTWRGYMEDMGKDPRRESATCGHAVVGREDRTLIATAADKYAAKHNPFVYFHSIIDDQARCDSHVVNLDALPGDLRSVRTTPNYVFITPNLCNDGHDPECIDGGPGGLQAVDAFLRKWVPLITAAPAFKQDGLLIVTFDESDGSGPDGSAACCGERPLASARRPAGVLGPGGGRIGAVLLSRFVKPGTVSTDPYNHYSLLRTVEDLFGLEHLGYAAEPNLKAFGADVFTAE